MNTNYVKNWFARGDDDLALVKLILEKGTASLNLACFHGQQAAEKYLKGFLAHHDLHVRKIHDLEVLLEDCKNRDPSFAELQDSARFLSQFYTESRYPDDYVEFSREDAEKAFDAALRIKEFVLNKIKPKQTSGFGWLVIIITVAGIAALAGGGYWVYNTYFPTVRIVCTDEAKLCPDGSAVGRTGPNCEFAICPGEDESTPQPIDTSTWKTYRNEQYGFEVRYPPDAKFANPYKGEETLIYLPFTRDTALREKFFDVEVKKTSSLETCTSFLWGVGVEEKEVVTVDGIQFMKEIAKAAAPGTGVLLRSESYSTLKQDECITLSFILGVDFSTPEPASYSPEKEYVVFNQILSTFKFTR